MNESTDQWIMDFFLLINSVIDIAMASLCSIIAIIIVVIVYVIIELIN